MTMCAQAVYKEEQHSSDQADFRVVSVPTNGSGLQSIPAGEGVENAPHIASTPPHPGDVPIPANPIEPKTLAPVQGALVAVTDSGESRENMYVQFEALPDGSVKTRMFNEASTLNLHFHTSPHQSESTLNIRTQFIGKPLGAALPAARFLELLSTQSGELFMELHEPHRERYPIAYLPLSVPEPKLEEYRDRLHILDGLHEIWAETGVEIGYPEQTEDDEGLRNFNVVLAAIQGGWATQSVSSLNIPIPANEVRALLNELRDQGEVLRAFMFDLPDESYRVFGKQVTLGPSRRYLAAARLATTREELEALLNRGPKDADALNLEWEPVDGTPVHVFFDEWPKSSVRSIDQELRELEVIYGLDSEHFAQSWMEREPSVRSLPDGKRWFSLVQAHEELTRDS